MEKRQPDGATLRQHLEAVRRATGREPQELDVPALPPQAAHLWDIYAQLAAARGSNGFGPNPIGWAELEAWQRLNGFDLSPWEAETLIHIDYAARAALAKDQ